MAVEAEEAGIDTRDALRARRDGPVVGRRRHHGQSARLRGARATRTRRRRGPTRSCWRARSPPSTRPSGIALAAVIAPLRHPLLLAKQLGDARPAGRGPARGAADGFAGTRTSTRRSACRSSSAARILDEQLVAMERAWQQSPASFEGKHFSFHDVYVEPKPYRPEGPRMWFGGMSLHDALLRRIVRYGHGFHPFGPPTPEELRAAPRGHGRSRPRQRRPGDDRRHPRPLRATPRRRPTSRRRSRRCRAAGAGYTSICFKPSMYTDDPAEVGDLCRRLVAMARAVAR